MAILKFHSVAEMDQAFRDYVESVRVQSLNSLVMESNNMIKEKYRNLPYPIQVAGEDVSKMPPKDIADAVEILSIDAKSVMIRINPKNADAVWSSRRYAALTLNGDPFAAVTKEMEVGAITRITGLKTYP